MGNGFLSRISWSGTLIFMLLRVAFGSVGLFVLLALAEGLSAGEVLVLRIVVLILSGASLLAAWLSQQGLPFAGIVSFACSLPMYLGDPLVWVLHKIRPEWVPVDEPQFLNPPFAWVLNE